MKEATKHVKFSKDGSVHYPVTRQQNSPSHRTSDEFFCHRTELGKVHGFAQQKLTGNGIPPASSIPFSKTYNYSHTLRFPLTTRYQVEFQRNTDTVFLVTTLGVSPSASVSIRSSAVRFGLLDAIISSTVPDQLDSLLIVHSNVSEVFSK